MQVSLRHRSGQTVTLPQPMAVGQDGTNQVGQFVGQEGVKGDDGRQATVDGSRIEAPGGLGGNKSVYIVAVILTSTRITIKPRVARVFVGTANSVGQDVILSRQISDLPYTRCQQDFCAPSGQT
jgi:hypothetical protein